MVVPATELNTAMVDTKMLLVTQVDQTIITTPAIGMYGTFDALLSSYAGLQSGLNAISHDFGLDSALPFRRKNVESVEVAVAYNL